MNQVFFASHSLDCLVEELFSQLQAQRASIFARSTIAIAHSSMKQWLQFEICRRTDGRAILGLEFAPWSQVVKKWLKPKIIPTRLELSAALWAALPEQTSLHLVKELTFAFEEYCFYGFPKSVPEEALWQKKLFQEIFQSRGWSTFPECAESTSECSIGSLHLFAIDYLPPAVQQLFFKVPDLCVYRFSPCAMYWEDLCSASERKKMLQRWEQKRVSKKSLESLDHMIRDTQPLLANWGMIGRSMLAGDAHIELKENYECREPESALDLLKLDLLLLQTRDQPLQIASSDHSIQCVRVGSSPFREIKWLRQEISLLVSQGARFSEIRVYAPDLSLYVPIVEFYLGDPNTPVPFQIEKVDLSRQSSFYQGIAQLFRCVKGRWEADEIATLFEMPAFRRKAKWQREEIQRFREWMKMAKIRWGLDAEHRKEVSDVKDVPMSDEGSWSRGWDVLIDRWMYLNPEREEALGWSELELFERVYAAFQQIQKIIISWRQPKTLADWAREIGEFVDSTLSVDEQSETDPLAKAAFDQFLDGLRKTATSFPSEMFPFSWVEMFFTSISKEEGTSQVNAVRFSELETGAILPAKYVFLIGMDEEGFPRNVTVSSLYLPSKDSHRKGDFDRYVFLQALFAAQEKVIFSYGHISKDDGKPVSPSLMIQELFAYLDSAFVVNSHKPSFTWIKEAPPLYRASPVKKSSLLLPTISIPPCKEPPLFLSIQELTRFFKHPLQAYLKKVLGIDWMKEPESAWKDFEFSSLDRHKELLTFLKRGMFSEVEFPLGLFKEAAKRDLQQRAEQFQQALQSWSIPLGEIRDLHFTQTGQKEGPISLRIGEKNVQLLGEGCLAVPRGVLHIGGDDIGSMLRKWPEMLTVLAATETRAIYCLKNRRIREVDDPLASLQATVELYLCCQNHPLFLHPEWADAVLRKNIDPDLDRTRDDGLRWILERSPLYDVSHERKIWTERLHSALASLASLFPIRGQHADV